MRNKGQVQESCKGTVQGRPARKARLIVAQGLSCLYHRFPSDHAVNSFVNALPPCVSSFRP